MKNRDHSRKIRIGLVLAGLLAATGSALAQDHMQGMNMQNHSDLHWLFSSFWWLIFPVFGMMTGLINMWQRHSRANRTIDIIKSYADQGKEPPPELLAALRSPEPMDYRKRGHGWIPVFLFGALAIGFATMGLTEGGGLEGSKGLYFVAIIMVGLCLGFLTSTLARERRDQDRNPPQ